MNSSFARASTRAGIMALFGVLASAVVYAHSGGTSYLHIDARRAESAIAMAWDIASTDLQWSLDLDEDGDGKVTARELADRRAAVRQLVLTNLELKRGGVTCSTEVSTLGLTSHAGQPYVSVNMAARCAHAGPLQVSSSLFFGSATYTALLEVQTAQGSMNAALSPNATRWQEPRKTSVLQTLARFVQQGIWHVLVGYDHIAFLLLLLLPSVLRGAPGLGQGPNARAAFRDIVGIVSAFTLAHSVTLSLAATGTLRLPTRPIEAAIAGSIVIAGLLNLFPAATRWRLWVAFGFGFVHGFGFANALDEIGAKGFALAPMLAGFNIGVECAQLMIVALALPVLLLAGRSPIYANRLMPALSIATGILGAAWLGARALP
jgi:HupE / UreJ protein